jgi:cysteine-rich repeat protein
MASNLFRLSLLLTLATAAAACGDDGDGGSGGNDTSDTGGDGSGGDVEDDTSDDTSDTGGSGDTSDDTSDTGVEDTSDDTSDTGGEDTSDDTTDTNVDDTTDTNVDDTTDTNVDDTTDTNVDDTTDTSTGPACGNGTVEGSEACDDGNRADGDGCSSECTVCTDDDLEPNGAESPRAITVPNCPAPGQPALEPLYTNRVAQSGNDDYYLFDLNPGCGARAFIDAPGSASLISVDLLDAGGESISSGTPSADGNTLEFLPAGILGGQVILKVNVSSAAECFAYELNICTPCG